LKVGPPGWQPHRIVTRVDGWMVLDPNHLQRIPPVIAEAMARARPQPSRVQIIRARMAARMAERGIAYE